MTYIATSTVAHKRSGCPPFQNANPALSTSMTSAITYKGNIGGQLVRHRAMASSCSAKKGLRWRTLFHREIAPFMADLKQIDMRPGESGLNL